MNNKQNNLIFISIPKTGTISVRKSLGLNSSYNHMTCRYIKKKIGDEKWDNCFKFTFIRNPYDRLVSWYFFHRDIQNIDLYQKYHFKSWIMDDCPNHWTKASGTHNPDPFNLCNYLLDENDNIMVDFVGRVENINKDFNKLTQAIGVPKKKLVHVNKSRRKGYKSYYDKESRGYVKKLFAKDFEIFKYGY